MRVEAPTLDDQNVAVVVEFCRSVSVAFAEEREHFDDVAERFARAQRRHLFRAVPGATVGSTDRRGVRLPDADRAASAAGRVVVAGCRRKGLRAGSRPARSGDRELRAKADAPPAGSAAVLRGSCDRRGLGARLRADRRATTLGCAGRCGGHCRWPRCPAHPDRPARTTAKHAAANPLREAGEARDAGLAGQGDGRAGTGRPGHTAAPQHRPIAADDRLTELGPWDWGPFVPSGLHGLRLAACRHAWTPLSE